MKQHKNIRQLKTRVQKKDLKKNARAKSRFLKCGLWIACVLSLAFLVATALEALCYGGYASPYSKSFCKGCEKIMQGRRACTSVFFKQEAAQVAPQMCLVDKSAEGTESAKPTNESFDGEKVR